MEAPLDHPAEEIKHLRRCINDLVGVLALAAVWTGSELPQIVNSLIDALLGTLSLDLIYVRLNGQAGEMVERMPLFVPLVRRCSQLTKRLFYARPYGRRRFAT